MAVQESIEIEELNAEDALDNFREMVGYVMGTDDKEIIDGYADTFMLIAKYYAKGEVSSARKAYLRHLDKKHGK